MKLELAGAKFMENNGHRLSLFTKLMGEFGLDRLPVKQKLPSASRPVHTPIGSTDPVAALADLADSPSLPSGPFSHLRVAIVHDFLYT